MFKEALMIPVFIFTEEEVTMDKIGIPNEDSGFNQTEIRAYWRIDSVHPYDDDTNKTCFYSGGTSFVTPQTFEGLVNLINSHIKK